jgi:hypothetical protein
MENSDALSYSEAAAKTGRIGLKRIAMSPSGQRWRSEHLGERRSAIQPSSNKKAPLERAGPYRSVELVY